RARVPASLQRYCVEKGSLALDGVSLTIAALRGDEVAIAVIPHTAQATTLGSRRTGEPLHVEVDVLAKYVERMLAARGLALEGPGPGEPCATPPCSPPSRWPPRRSRPSSCPRRSRRSASASPRSSCSPASPRSSRRPACTCSI